MKKKTQTNTKSLKKSLKRKKYVKGSRTTVKTPSQKDLENMRKKGLSTTLPTTPAKKKTTPTTIPGPSTPKGGSVPQPLQPLQPIKENTRTTTPTTIPARQRDLLSPFPFVDTKLPDQPTSGSIRESVGRGRGVPTTGNPRGNITESLRGLGSRRPNIDFQQPTGVGRTPPPPPRVTLTADQRKQAEARRQEAVNDFIRRQEAVNDFISRGRDATNVQNAPVEQFAPSFTTQNASTPQTSNSFLYTRSSPRDSDGSQEARRGRRNGDKTTPTPTPTPTPTTTSTTTSIPAPWWQQRGYGSKEEAFADGWRFVPGEGWVQTLGDGDPPEGEPPEGEPPEGDPPEGDPPPPSDKPKIETGLPDDAPTTIRQQAPEVVLKQMNATLTAGGALSPGAQRMLEDFIKEDPDGVTGRQAKLTLQKAGLSTDVEQLGEAPEAEMTDVDARTLDVSQGTIQQAGLETGDPARGFEATTVSGELPPTEAAQEDTLRRGTAGQAKAEDVDTAERDTAAEEAAKGEAATRPKARDYAKAATTDDRFIVGPIDGPDVDTRTGVTIPQSKIDELTKLAKDRGLDPTQAIEEYRQSMGEREAQTADAAQKVYTPRLGESPEETAARAEYYGADYTPQGGKTEIDDTPAYKKAATRKAATGEAAQRIATELGNAPSTDLEGREAITGTAPAGDAAQIGGVPTMAAATRQAVTGQERNVAASDMNAVVADLPEEITAAIAQNPAEPKIIEDLNADPQVTAAVAALPTEALVSTQMESLLAGMEEGETPAWARPAVDAINQQMARRGLSVSTVGRDALFNAIIQSALPIAQSNATALQTRAQQNLSNEQQANLATAQNTMQVRMQNLANRQTAASQTAQMAQQIAVQQGTFDQQAVMTTAQQQQETNLANAQMAQQRAQQESSQRQQAAIAQLSTNAQMDLANLQALNAAGSERMSADQQSKLATYNAQVAKIMRQAELTQDMEKANLSPALQVEMQRVSEINAAARDTMTAENQERLVELQTLIDFRKTDATFAQQMDMANMSNEQQIELAMLQEKAATDAANFTADNQFELTRLNNIVARSVRQAELNSRMEEVNLDAKLKVELSELSEKNTTSRANMTAEQQTRLANLNVLVDFRKTNAAMAQQMDVANLANEQQMELALLQERSNVDAANFTEDNRTRMQSLNTYVQVMSQNEQLLQNADMAKLSMQEKINLANLNSQSQADMASMTAENRAELLSYEKRMQAGQVNAQLAQQMGLAELSNEQQAAMFNAQIDAGLDMRQFDANQQMELANSKFLQSMTMTQFNADQQSAISNAVRLTQVDLANADARTKVSVENAKNFLTVDMANLNNRQQGIVLDQQMRQQALLSDQAAENAAKQFGATSANQLNQFLISQSNSMKQFNTSARNAMESFNATEANRMEAIEAGNFLQADTFTAQLEADINKFNVQIDNQREQWNAANAQAVEQSNINWRRQSNTIDTAAQNAANQQNVQNAYNISALDQTQLWQQLRDEASYIRQAYENNEQREAQLLATAIGNEAGASEKTSTSTSALLQLLKTYGGIE